MGRKRFLVWILPAIGVFLNWTCRNVQPEKGTQPAAEVNISDAPVTPKLAQFLQEYDQYFNQQMRLSGTPGAALAIVIDHRIVWLKGYGVTYAGGNDSVDTHTVFRLGSLSKGFSGVLAGLLVKDDLLCWSDPICWYFPTFQLRDQQQAKRIQVRHVLSHTTGLPYHAFTNLIEAGYNVETIAESYFPRTQVFGKEGEIFSYQNAAFCAIEPVAEKVTGLDYPQLLKTRIFQPCGMHNASCDYWSMVQSENHALPHVFNGYRWTPDSITTRYYNAPAAGGINAGIADMAQWLQLLLGDKPQIAPDSVLDQVFEPVIRTYGERRHFAAWPGERQAWYAMGWRVLETETDTIICHGGYVNGFKSEIAVNRKTGVGICALFNAHTEMCRQVIPEFYQRWRKLQSPAVPATTLPMQR